ncbi:hypothetical protein GCM10009851_34880 [Herbiconiux moechotypicola]|uniref:Uncharacterized protein n=2 Tax=Herbiconiux moechotypicola TaxID=637393 RepID=A0ABP5QX45_9MICO
MPAGELFDWAAHRGVGDRCEFVGEPAFEAGEGVVSGRELSGVDEDGADVFHVAAGRECVEGFVGGREGAASELGEDVDHAGVSHPGDDALGTVGGDQRFQERHRGWLRGAVGDKETCEVDAEAAAGAGAFAIAGLFFAAGPAVELGRNAGALNTDAPALRV